MTEPTTLNDRARAATRHLTDWAGTMLHRLGIHPDALTIAGLAVVAAAALVIAQGQLQLGGLILALGLPLDALDGAVARARGLPNPFGGVLDSTLDRYADAFIFGGLSYHFAVHNRPDMLLLCYAALIGAFGVSYVRARAGEAGLSVKIGLFDRLVRVVVIVAALLLPPLLEWGLLLLAVGANATALRRLWYVHRHIR